MYYRIFKKRKELAQNECVGYILGADTMYYDFEHSMCLQVSEAVNNSPVIFSFRTSPCEIYHVFTTYFYSSNAYNLQINL